MVGRSAEVWEKIVKFHTVFSANLHEWENQTSFFRGDHDVPVNLATDADLEVNNYLNFEGVNF